MSSRRKMSTSANAQIMSSGRKIRKRKNVSQNVVAMGTAGLLAEGLRRVYARDGA
jgi:hypothetical protein